MQQIIFQVFFLILSILIFLTYIIGMFLNNLQFVVFGSLMYVCMSYVLFG